MGNVIRLLTGLFEAPCWPRRSILEAHRQQAGRVREQIEDLKAQLKARAARTGIRDNPEIAHELRTKQARLTDIRKSLAVGGHTEALLEIDSLIGVAAQEMQRRLKTLENKP